MKQNSKIYDLEERTLKFAKDVRIFVRDLGKIYGIEAMVSKLSDHQVQ